MVRGAGVVIRDFELSNDLSAIKKIWREIGWADSASIEAGLGLCYAVGRASVATLKDEVECAVQTVPGTMRLHQSDLPLCVVAAVTTSRVARGLSLAQKLTVRELAIAADQGAAVAALGMFDQGFYDKVGFATGAYHNEFSFDPATLAVDRKVSTPRRLAVADFAEMHAVLMSRPRNHGAVAIESAEFFHADIAMKTDGFGLGFDSKDGLSHFVWMTGKAEHGPYRVEWLGYQTGEQLLDLLALLKSLSDQLYSVCMMEPPEIQLQRMLRRPFRVQAIANKGKFAARQETFAWYQLRVLDVVQCIAAVVWPGETLRCQLSLRDPVQGLLTDHDGWQGVQGDYIIELGATSSARRGVEVGLPVLDCSVSTLSRLVWGVATASSLCLTDDLRADARLLPLLDRVFVERPHPFWDF